METLSIQGKEYVKASKIAREFGYTSDYIGQLCRGKKIDAQLVGRSWYVNKDSLTAHKEGRYKKIETESLEPKVGYAVSVNKEKSQSLEEFTDKINSEEKSSADTLLSKSFYNRVPRLVKTPVYHVDEADLIPAVKKRKGNEKSSKINVELADASQVSVSSVSEKYEFTTPKLAKVKFKGSLNISKVPEHKEFQIPEVEPGKIEDSKKLEKTKSVTVNEKENTQETLSAVVVDNPVKSVKVNKSISRNSVAMKRRSRLKRNTQEGTIQIPKKDADKPAVSSNKAILVVSAMASVAILLGLFGLELQISTNGEQVVEEYVFSIEDMKAAVYGFKSSYFGS